MYKASTSEASIWFQNKADTLDDYVKRMKILEETSEPTPDAALQRLIYASYYPLNEKAIINLIQNKSSAARAKYLHGRFVGAQYPILLFLQLNASFNLINTLYKAFPQAIKEKHGHQKQTLLHLACTLLAPLNVVSLFVDGWPEAMETKDANGRLPLHYACCCNCIGDDSLNVISSLLEKCPSSVKMKDNQGRLPLHLLCMHSPSSKAMSLLLEKYPHAVEVKDKSGKTPFDLYFSKNMRSCDSHEKMAWMMLDGIDSLLRNEKEDKTITTQIMKDFLEIEWWGGLVLALDLSSPSVAAQCLKDIPLNTFPSLLTMIGRHSNISMLWKIMTERQDVLEIK